MNYPNPCDACEKADTCREGYGCEKWRIRFLWYWKRLNAYLRRCGGPVVEKTTAFVYEHPDIIRRYLEKGPCGKCRRAKTCETPCAVYWRWWDARMEWIKWRLL